MNEISENIVNICIESLTAQVADRYAESHSISATEALQLFMTTKTFELLSKPESFLYLEPAQYIEDLLNAELSGDWETRNANTALKLAALARGDGGIPC
jgi:hypothetical protein